MSIHTELDKLNILYPQSKDHELKIVLGGLLVAPVVSDDDDLLSVEECLNILGD